MIVSPDPQPEALLSRLIGGRASEGEPARELLAMYGLHGLSRLCGEELTQGHALTPGQAGRLEAAFALGRWVERERLDPCPHFSRPEAVYRLLAPELRGEQQESFHALFLDPRHRLKGRQIVSLGTLTSSLVHPREVFAPALRRGAAALIVAHNHPSGDPEPSSEDKAVTRRLLEVGRLVGVPLLDHVVLGHGRWVSLRESMGF
ncbi:MAG TPA: DNA repair protein RadC [Planctomycetes bacterium]|nr:DNA repair protein RadC [Planctomycetota bacterium]